MIADNEGKWREAIGAGRLAWLRDHGVMPVRDQRGRLIFLDGDICTEAIDQGTLVQADVLSWI